MSADGPSLTQLRALMQARADDDEAQAVAERAASRRRQLELEVHEAMTWAGIKGQIKRDLGPPWGVQGFTAKATETGYVYDENALIGWAKRKGMLGAFFGEPVARKKAINLHVKRARRGQAELPDGVEPRERPYVSVRHYE